MDANKLPVKPETETVIRDGDGIVTYRPNSETDDDEWDDDNRSAINEAKNKCQ